MARILFSAPPFTRLGRSDLASHVLNVSFLVVFAPKFKMDRFDLIDLTQQGTQSGAAKESQLKIEQS
jgi:hypothetical protein